MHRLVGWGSAGKLSVPGDVIQLDLPDAGALQHNVLKLGQSGKGPQAMPHPSSRKARGGIMSPNHSVLKVLLFSLAGAALALLVAAMFI